MVRQLLSAQMPSNRSKRLLDVHRSGRCAYRPGEGEYRSGRSRTARAKAIIAQVRHARRSDRVTHRSGKRVQPADNH
ncbi:hypothetical protein ACMGD3_21015 [Lysinibacillus sphaericus]|uniref:hypothetical protein n=1 Tax=Lysinibacillus sphaericus TaxID=1421 RepID=UPI003F78E623